MYFLSISTLLLQFQFHPHLTLCRYELTAGAERGERSSCQMDRVLAEYLTNASTLNLCHAGFSSEEKYMGCANQKNV